MTQAQVPFTPPAIPPAYLASPAPHQLALSRHPDAGSCVRILSRGRTMLVPVVDWRRYVDEAAVGLFGAPFIDLILAHQAMATGEAVRRVDFFKLGVPQ